MKGRLVCISCLSIFTILLTTAFLFSAPAHSDSIKRLTLASGSDLVEKGISPNQFAYQDINTAPEHSKEAITESREKIIYSYSWTADGITGIIIDKDGNAEEVPEFHELFPAEWGIPNVNG